MDTSSATSRPKEQEAPPRAAPGHCRVGVRRPRHGPSPGGCTFLCPTPTTLASGKLAQKALGETYPEPGRTGAALGLPLPLKDRMSLQFLLRNFSSCSQWSLPIKDQGTLCSEYLVGLGPGAPSWPSLQLPPCTGLPAAWMAGGRKGNRLQGLSWGRKGNEPCMPLGHTV